MNVEIIMYCTKLIYFLLVIINLQLNDTLQQQYDLGDYVDYSNDDSAEIVNDDSSCLKPYCKCIDKYSLICENFSHFSQLNFKKLTKLKNTFKSIVLYPNVSLSIDESLNLDGLELLNEFEIAFQDINSIKANLKLFNKFKNLKSIMFSGKGVSHHVEFKYIDDTVGTVYSHKHGHHSSHVCHTHMDNGVFSNLKLKSLKFINTRFKNQICEFLLRNSEIDEFEYTSTTSLDPLQFPQFEYAIASSDTSKYDQSIRIRHFSIGASTIELQHKPNKHLVKNFKEFSMLAYKLDINDAYFKPFINLRRLNLLMDFEQLLINNFNWLQSLNSQVNIENMDKKTQIDQKYVDKIFLFNFDSFRLVNLTDDYFCLFANYPHEQLVWPIINFQNYFYYECSCTVYWLYKYYKLYENTRIKEFQSNWFDYLPTNCLYIDNLDEKLNECNFEARLKTCDPPVNKHTHKQMSLSDLFGLDTSQTHKVSNSAYKLQFSFMLFLLLKFVLYFIRGVNDV